MKKSFAYLIVVLLMTAMLTGCGDSRTADDGALVTAAPAATPSPMATLSPSPSPMTTPDAGNGTVTDGDGVIGNGDTAADDAVGDAAVTNTASPSAKAGA